MPLLQRRLLIFINDDLVIFTFVFISVFWSSNCSSLIPRYFNHDFFNRGINDSQMYLRIRGPGNYNTLIALKMQLGIVDLVVQQTTIEEVETLFAQMLERYQYWNIPSALPVLCISGVKQLLTNSSLFQIHFQTVIIALVV